MQKDSLDSLRELMTVYPEGGHSVARRKKEEDLEDLVDDLEDLEVDDEEDDDEVEIEDDDLDEDEDPDEAPKAKRKRSSKKSPAKKQRTGIGTKELADAAGVEPRVLRNYLRSADIQPKGDREGRYEWKSLNDPEAKRIVKAVRDGKRAEAAKEKNTEAKGKKSTAKKSTSRRKKTNA